MDRYKVTTTAGEALISAPQQNYPGRPSTSMGQDSRHSGEEDCPIPILYVGRRSGEETPQSMPVREPVPGMFRCLVFWFLTLRTTQCHSKQVVRMCVCLLWFRCRGHILLLFQNERNVFKPHATVISADPDPPSNDSVSDASISLISQFTCCVDNDCNCGLLGCSYRHRHRRPNPGSNIHP